MIEDELPNPETRTPEQLLIDGITESAESALNSRGQVIEDGFNHRAIYEEGWNLEETRDKLGNSVFSLWRGNRFNGETVHGEWTKGGSEVVAEVDQPYVDVIGEKTVLDMEGLAELKAKIDAFQSPGMPETSSTKVPKGKLAQFMGRKAMRVQERRDRRRDKIG